MDKADRNWKLGLFLVFLSDFFWGLQPVALSFLVKSIPPADLALYKNLAGTLILGTFLAARGQLPSLRRETRKSLVLLLLAGISLGLSSLFFAFSFAHITAANAQMYIQLTKLFLIMEGIFLFKEKFSRVQWFGLLVLIGGFYLFFSEQSLLATGNYTFGVLLVVGASLMWAVYAGIQKSLLSDFSPLQILFVIYLVSSFFLFPTFKSFPADLLSAVDWVILGLVCTCHLLAFAFFSLALQHWDVSRISAVSSLTPIFTFILSIIFIGTEKLGVFTILGACAVVGASATISLYQGKK